MNAPLRVPTRRRILLMGRLLFRREGRCSRPREPRSTPFLPQSFFQWPPGHPVRIFPLNLKEGTMTRFRKLVCSALLVGLVATASGCASPWTFGTTKWVAQETAYTDHESPKVLVLVPFVVFDLIVFPIALIHDA